MVCERSRQHLKEKDLYIFKYNINYIIKYRYGEIKMNKVNTSYKQKRKKPIIRHKTVFTLILSLMILFSVMVSGVQTQVLDQDFTVSAVISEASDTASYALIDSIGGSATTAVIVVSQGPYVVNTPINFSGSTSTIGSGGDSFYDLTRDARYQLSDVSDRLETLSHLGNEVSFQASLLDNRSEPDKSNADTSEPCILTNDDTSEPENLKDDKSQSGIPEDVVTPPTESPETSEVSTMGPGIDIQYAEMSDSIESISRVDTFEEQGGVLTYSWNFGDGTTNQSGENVIHSYSSPGIYTVILTVTDSSSGTDTDTLDLAITPRQVTGVNVTSTGDEMLRLIWDENDNATYYIIYKDGDSLENTVSTTSYFDTEVTKGTEYEYNVAAVYRYEDEYGQNDLEGPKSEPASGTPEKSQINIPPEAIIEKESYCNYTGVPLGFKSLGKDPDGKIVSWTWDFGDGSSGEGEIASHAYTQVENYTVSLTVTDNESATNTTTAKVMIVGSSAAYPTADAGGPYFVHVDDQIVFNGSKSHDSVGTITNYTWDFGDETKGFGVSPTHTYITNGTFIVTLTVIDNDGLSDKNNTFVVVTNENRCPSKPTITGPINGSVGVEYEYSIFAIGPDGDMVQYVIDWNDGVITTMPFFPSETTASTRHMWNSAGTYYVTAYAEDEYGAVSEIVNLTVIIIGENTENMLLGQTGGNIGFLNGNGSEGILYLVIVFIAAIGAVLFWYRKKVFGNKNLLCDACQDGDSQDSMGRLSITQEPSNIAPASPLVVFKEESPTQSSIDDVDLGMFCPT